MNINFKTLLAVALFFVALVPVSAAQNQESEIRHLFENRDQQIKQVLGNNDVFSDEQKDQLKHLINDDIDFGAMGKTALGKYWADLSADQKSEFVEVFGDIVRRQSLADLDIYRSKVTYEQFSIVGDSAYVLTNTLYKKTDAKVEYLLGQKDGKWWVHDIVLDDVSTVDGYARSFQTVIRKRKFEGLMRSLRKKRDKMKS